MVTVDGPQSNFIHPQPNSEDECNDMKQSLPLPTLASLPKRRTTNHTSSSFLDIQSPIFATTRQIDTKQQQEDDDHRSGRFAKTDGGTPETLPETPESGARQHNRQSFRFSSPSSPTSDNDSSGIQQRDFNHSLCFASSEEDEDHDDERSSEYIMEEDEANKSHDSMENMPYKHLISSLTQHQDEYVENKENQHNVSTITTITTTSNNGSSISINGDKKDKSPLGMSRSSDDIDDASPPPTTTTPITTTSTPKRESIDSKRASSLFDSLYSMARTPTPQKTPPLTKQEQWNQWWQGADTPSPDTPNNYNNNNSNESAERCVTPIRRVGGGGGFVDGIVGDSQEWHVPSPRLLSSGSEEDASSVGKESLNDDDCRSIEGDLSQDYFFEDNAIVEKTKAVLDISSDEIETNTPSPPAPSSNGSVALSTPSPVAKSILDFEGEQIEEMEVETPRVDNTTHLDFIPDALLSTVNSSCNLLLDEHFPDDSFMNEDFVLAPNGDQPSVKSNEGQNNEQEGNSSALDLLQQLQEPEENMSVERVDTHDEKQSEQAVDMGINNDCMSNVEISDEQGCNEDCVENFHVATENELNSSVLKSYVVEIDGDQCSDNANGTETLLHSIVPSSLPDITVKEEEVKEEDFKKAVEAKVQFASQTNVDDEQSKNREGEVMECDHVNCKGGEKIAMDVEKDQSKFKEITVKCQPLKSRDAVVKEENIVISTSTSNETDLPKGKTIPTKKSHHMKLDSRETHAYQDAMRTSDIGGGCLVNVENVTPEQASSSSMKKLRELRGLNPTSNCPGPLPNDIQNGSKAEVPHSEEEDTFSCNNQSPLLSIQDLLARDKSSRRDYVDIIPSTKSNDDDISDISSLGSSSIKSSKSARLMNRNLCSKSRVLYSAPSPLDNIIQDFQFIQRSRKSQGWRPRQNPKDLEVKELEDIQAEKDQRNSSFVDKEKLTTMQFVKNDPLMRSDTKKRIKRSGLVRNGSFCSVQSTPCTLREQTKLAPSKTDTRSGNRRSVRRNRKKNFGTKSLDVSVDINVLDQYQQLQAELATVERNNKIKDSMSKKVDRYEDTVQYEDLFEQFKMIELKEGERIRVEVNNRKSYSADINSSASSIVSGGQSISNTSFTLKTSNDWFVDFESIKDDGFSSLLKKKENMIDERVIESKKRLYTNSSVNQSDKLSKKKRKKILKKLFSLMKRKSKSKNDTKESQTNTEGALGISSVSSVNVHIREQEKCHQKKAPRMRFSFRRKKKKSKTHETTFEDESLCNGDDQKVYDRIIRESLEMMPDINIEDLNASDFSFSDSDVSDNTSCNSICGYQTLS